MAVLPHSGACVVGHHETCRLVRVGTRKPFAQPSFLAFPTRHGNPPGWKNPVWATSAGIPANSSNLGAEDFFVCFVGGRETPRTVSVPRLPSFIRPSLGAELELDKTLSLEPWFMPFLVVVFFFLLDRRRERTPVLRPRVFECLRCSRGWHC
jgi:hypothetical protein